MEKRNHDRLSSSRASRESRGKENAAKVGKVAERLSNFISKSADSPADTASKSSLVVDYLVVGLRGQLVEDKRVVRKLKIPLLPQL